MISNTNLEISFLPFEIAEIISKHLDDTSLANCCLVNKHWYACFISSLWESPSINGLNHLKSLHHSLESIDSILNEEEEEKEEKENQKEDNTNENKISFSDSFNSSKLIKKLNLMSLVDEYDISEQKTNATSFDYADSQTRSLLRELSTHCPHLKSLALKVPSEKNSSKDAPNFFYSLGQFAKTALKLESLTLDFNDMTVFSEHLEESIPAEAFSKLQTLNLQNSTMVDDSSFIWIWSNCPNLTSFTISQSSNLNDYILNPLIRLRADKLKVFNLERCSRLSINSLLNIIVSCKNLENLRWVNNGASFMDNLLSDDSSSDFEIKDMVQFMNALKENCVIHHLKLLDYAFLKANKASVIFDYLIDRNKESLEVIKCDTSKALISASQNNVVFPHLKEVSFNNKNVSLKDLSKSCSTVDLCEPKEQANSTENNNNMNLAA